MNFKPKKENELSPLLEKREYEFNILSAKDEISEKGNQMIKLTVEIFKDGEKVAQIFDYLLEKVAYKLRHCASACGLIDKYDTGNLEAMMFVGLGGKCIIEIQKDKDGIYPDKNGIKDYVKKDDKENDLPF